MTFKTFHELFWLFVFSAAWIWIVRLLRGSVIPAFRSGVLVFPKNTIHRAAQPARFWLAIVTCILSALGLSFAIIVQATLLFARWAGVP